jgi:dTDP-L-rhamnose 4-epimerase
LALRLFNVYGPRQALSNPYTGVLAIFASRLLNERPPLMFEDGRQRRDFVSVHDVARAFRLALERSDRSDRVFNVASGQSLTVQEVGVRMARHMGKPHLPPTVTGKYRVGDIRHCFADIGAVREALGYAPQVTFDEGLGELVAWLRGQSAEDRVEQAGRELEERGLTL